MPSSEVILSVASAIANQYSTLAIAWHVLLGVLLVVLLFGWLPLTRSTGYLIAAPVLSVSALAWASGNPFNGATFAVLAALLITAASRMGYQLVSVASLRLLLPGALLVAYGWTYPHFLKTDNWTTYMYAAPFGLLPCPTLSVAIGLTLMLDLLRSKAWSMTLAAAGFMYGAIGVFTLGVTLDYGLLAGAVMLGVVASGRLKGAFAYVRADISPTTMNYLPER